MEPSRRSFSSHIKRVRKAVTEFGEEERRATILRELSEIEHKIAMTGEDSRRILERIKRVMTLCPPIEATDDAKGKVVQRALAKLAPFHRARNSVGDGLLLEIFVGAAEAEMNEGGEFFFVTHNTRNFSQQDGDQRDPHADHHQAFATGKRHYAISVVDVVKRIDGEMLAEYEWERTYHPEPRGLAEIIDAEHLLFRQVWFNRHMNLRL